MIERVVIAGAGVSGHTTANCLRREGYSGEIVLLSEEWYEPYDRPPLSKGVLSGDDVSWLEPGWQSLNVEMRLGEAVTALEAGAVHTEGGRLAFDHLVIATGAIPRRLPPVLGQPCPLHLRTVTDARALRSRLKPGSRLVIVGAGWLGAEVASTASRLGCKIVMIDGQQLPLSGVLPVEVSLQLAPWFRDVELLTRVEVSAAGLYSVELADGREIVGDTVLTAIGVRPATSWVNPTVVALDREGAVRADETLRSTASGVFALGDCASWPSLRYGRRVRREHWDASIRGAGVVAANIVGGSKVFDPIPYFWSYQWGRMLQFIGDHTSAGKVLWRGDPKVDRRWCACWIAGGRLVAMLSVDLPRDLAQAKRLIASGAAVDRDRLASPSNAVKDCVASV